MKYYFSAKIFSINRKDISGPHQANNNHLSSPGRHQPSQTLDLALADLQQQIQNISDVYQNTILPSHCQAEPRFNQAAGKILHV